MCKNYFATALATDSDLQAVMAPDHKPIMRLSTYSSCMCMFRKSPIWEGSRSVTMLESGASIDQNFLRELPVRCQRQSNWRFANGNDIASPCLRPLISQRTVKKESRQSQEKLSNFTRGKSRGHILLCCRIGNSTPSPKDDIRQAWVVTKLIFWC